MKCDQDETTTLGIDVHQRILSCSLSPLGLVISDLRNSKLPQKFRAFCLCGSVAELIEVQERLIHQISTQSTWLHSLKAKREDSRPSRCFSHDFEMVEAGTVHPTLPIHDINGAPRFNGG